ncbi:hypothetical protein CRG98_025982 [Punica granatum]|uniref:Uncharacterized protein n=1 Tax=Punica granatum TaxID=22663 RepID=A0A2I0JBL2_PUNGR|nr:hypothetical protein CRG98_025982 [Punica granatum]
MAKDSKGMSYPFATLGFVLCPVSLFETPRLCIVEAALVGMHSRPKESSRSRVPLGHVGWDMLCSSELLPVIFRGGRVGSHCRNLKGCLLVKYFLQWDMKNNERARRTVCSFNARAKGSRLAWLASCERTEGRMLRIRHGQGEMCSHDI